MSDDKLQYPNTDFEEARLSNHGGKFRCSLMAFVFW